MSRIDELKKALEKNPNNPLGLYGLALELYKAERYQEAIVEFLKYLNIYDDQGAAYRTLAQCYLNLGEIQKAIETLEAGVQKAIKYNHPTMAQEFKEEIERLKQML